MPLGGRWAMQSPGPLSCAPSLTPPVGLAGSPAVLLAILEPWVLASFLLPKEKHVFQEWLISFC